MDRVRGLCIAKTWDGTLVQCSALGQNDRPHGAGSRRPEYKARPNPAVFHECECWSPTSGSANATQRRTGSALDWRRATGTGRPARRCITSQPALIRQLERPSLRLPIPAYLGEHASKAPFSRDVAWRIWLWLWLCLRLRLRLRIWTSYSPLSASSIVFAHQRHRALVRRSPRELVDSLTRTKSTRTTFPHVGSHCLAPCRFAEIEQELADEHHFAAALSPSEHAVAAPSWRGGSSGGHAAGHDRGHRCAQGTTPIGTFAQTQNTLVERFQAAYSPARERERERARQNESYFQTSALTLHIRTRTPSGLIDVQERELDRARGECRGDCAVARLWSWLCLCGSERSRLETEQQILALAFAPAFELASVFASASTSVSVFERTPRALEVLDYILLGRVFRRQRSPLRLFAHVQHQREHEHERMALLHLRTSLFHRLERFQIRIRIRILPRSPTGYTAYTGSCAFHERD